MNGNANPVGIVLKDIYVIKNDINDKLYIGQAIDAAKRFDTHCKPSSARDNTLIDKAIQKYGKEHFWFEIIEHGIADYNQREKYWIATFNSMTPNGYNILSGGEQPPRYCGDSHPTTKLFSDQVNQLKEDLKNTSIPLGQLALKYNISKRHVLRINQGLTRSSQGESYPLRKVPNSNGKLSEDDVDNIIYLLQNTYMLSGEIGSIYGVNDRAISRINKGTFHKKEGIQYPIRSWKSCGTSMITYTQVTQIINLLLHSDMSMRQIGLKYGLTCNQIILINTGMSKRFRRKNLQYPLRNPRRQKKQPCNDYPREEE